MKYERIRVVWHNGLAHVNPLDFEREVRVMAERLILEGILKGGGDRFYPVQKPDVVLEEGVDPFYGVVRELMDELKTRSTVDYPGCDCGFCKVFHKVKALLGEAT